MRFLRSMPPRAVFRLKLIVLLPLAAMVWRLGPRWMPRGYAWVTAGFVVLLAVLPTGMFLVELISVSVLMGAISLLTRWTSQRFVLYAIGIPALTASGLMISWVAWLILRERMERRRRFRDSGVDRAGRYNDRSDANR
jgi:hypothetical protein